MISREHRFHGYGSLNYVHRKGAVVRSQQLLLKHIVNQRRATYRAAVVVSKKVHKSAVVRNRIRRRLYEIIRQEHIGVNQDFVVMVFDERLATMPAPEVQRQLHGLLKKAGLLSKNGQPR